MASGVGSGNTAILSSTQLSLLYSQAMRRLRGVTVSYTPALLRTELEHLLSSRIQLLTERCIVLMLEGVNFDGNEVMRRVGLLSSWLTSIDSDQRRLFEIMALSDRCVTEV